MVEASIVQETKERLDVGKVLILGGSGLVSQRFLELYTGDFITPSHSELDITDAEAVKKLIGREKPDVIINFSAYTDVSGGQREGEKGNKKGNCWKINVEGVRNILNAIDPEKTHFVQISTDMVFSGNKEFPGPYKEDQTPYLDDSTLTWYGYTKAVVEREIIEKLGDKATILRIISPTRANFDRKLDIVRAVVDAYEQGKPISRFDDQQISITFVDEACEALKIILERKLYGIFHASSRDTGTPYEIASYVLEKKYGVKNIVRPSSLDEFFAKTGDHTRYLKFDGLNVDSTERRLGMKFSTWREIVDRMVVQWVK